MRRRRFLAGALAGLVCGPGLVAAKPARNESPLNFHHTHTDEEFSLSWSAIDGIASLDHRMANEFLRDFRTGEAVEMDLRLFGQLKKLRDRVGNQEGVFEIISAYRSPATNQMLQKRSSGVARKSLHMEGRALDVRLRGTPTSDLRDAAVAMQLGGVGYYRRSDFIHIDTGRVRFW